MAAKQTRPIGGDKSFFTVRDALNPLLARHGFPLVQYKGSASWLAGTSEPGRAAETYFKLTYHGPNRPYLFAIRKDFASQFKKLHDLKWPVEFSVMPSTDILFLGFEVRSNEVEVAVQRVEKLLKALPEPTPEVAIPVHIDSHGDFDRQLENL